MTVYVNQSLAGYRHFESVKIIKKQAYIPTAEVSSSHRLHLTSSVCLLQALRTSMTEVCWVNVTARWQ